MGRSQSKSDDWSQPPFETGWMVRFINPEERPDKFPARYNSQNRSNSISTQIEFSDVPKALDLVNIKDQLKKLKKALLDNKKFGKNIHDKIYIYMMF